MVDHPRSVLVSLLLGTIAIGTAFHDVTFFQEDIGDLDPTNPEVRYFKDFQERFGDDETITVAVSADDIFTAPVLRYMHAVSDAAAGLPEIDHTESIVNAEDVRMEVGSLSVHPLFDPIPDDPAALQAARETALGHAYWPGSLLSRDGTLAAIHLTLRRADTGAIPRIEATEKLRELIAAMTPPPGTETYLAGRGPIIVDSQRYVESDFKRFLWLTPVLIILLLVYLLRSLTGVLIPLGITGLSVFWTFGLFLAAGNQISLVITMMPTLIAVIGLSDTIHIIAHYYEQTAEGSDRRSALLRTTEHMVGTCFLTSLTTAIGIGSLALSGLRSIQMFALWSAIGIGVAYLLAVTAVPALLAIVPPPTGRNRLRFANSLTSALMVRIADSKHVRAMAACVLIGSAIMSLGIFRLVVDTRFSANLPDNAPANTASKLLQEKLSGTNFLNVVLEGPEYAFEEPAALQCAAKLQQFLVAQPEINHAFSAVDLIRELHTPTTTDDDTSGADDSNANASLGVPNDAGAIATDFFRLRQTAMLNRLIDEDARTLCIYARLNDTGTSQQIKLLERIEAFGAQHVPSDLTLRTTGSAKLFAVTSHELVTGQTRSLLFSFLGLAVVMIVALRSFRLTLLSMIPNTLPVLVTLGFMGFMGIPLGTATVMISCIAIGIAVDDTVHFIARYRRELGRNPDPVRRTILSTGQAILFTTIVFSGGFLVFAFSSFEPTRHFGLLTAFAMIAALIADLLLLPYLLKLPLGGASPTHAAAGPLPDRRDG